MYIHLFKKKKSPKKPKTATKVLEYCSFLFPNNPFTKEHLFQARELCA